MKGKRKLMELSREHPRSMLYILAKLSSGSYIRKNKKVMYIPTDRCNECGRPTKHKKEVVTSIWLINNTFPYLEYLTVSDYQFLLKYRLIEQIKYSINYRMPKRFVVRSILTRRYIKGNQ